MANIETLKRGNTQIAPRTLAKAVTMQDGETVEAKMKSKADKATTLAGYGITDAITAEDALELIRSNSNTNSSVSNQIQADWNQTDETKVDYIKNKPTILTEEDVLELIPENSGGTTLNDYEFVMTMILGYSVLTSKPDDWETNYATYYENTGTLIKPVYKALTELKEWQSGLFYSYSNEDVAMGSITKSPDGQSFGFKGVILDMSFPAAPTRTIKFSLRSMAGTATANQLMEISTSSAIKSSEKGFYQGCFEALNGGIWKGIHNINYTTAAFISRQIPRTEPMRALTWGSTSLPAGTTITMYGVRV